MPRFAVSTAEAHACVISEVGNTASPVWRVEESCGFVKRAGILYNPSLRDVFNYADVNANSKYYPSVTANVTQGDGKEFGDLAS